MSRLSQLLTNLRITVKYARISGDRVPVAVLAEQIADEFERDKAVLAAIGDIIESL